MNNKILPSAALPYAKAICYSGYRDGQSPETDELPSYEEVKQDLLILKGEWQSLRLYASDAHSEMVLNVIDKECAASPPTACGCAFAVDAMEDAVK